MRMYRAVVTRANANGIWVKIASVLPGVEIGPLSHVANIVRVPSMTTSSSQQHTHTLAAHASYADKISAGDRVLVAETDSDDFVVIGALRRGVSATGNAS